MAERTTAEDYTVYEPDWDDAEGFPIEFEDGVNIDLIEELGTEEMNPRMWRLEPGEKLSYHYHEQQEEVFYVVQGTGTLLVGSDMEEVTVPEGGFFRPETTTPRQVRNDGDEDVIWFIVGAPSVMEGKLWDEYDADGRPDEDGEFKDLGEFI